MLRILLGLWGNFSAWDDRDLVTAKTAASVPHVEAALREIQRESRQFQMMALREMGVRTPQLSAPVDIYPRSRVDALEVYSRPARDYVEALEATGSAEDAWRAFERRMDGIVEADVVAAERDEVERIQDQLIREGIAEEPDGEPLYDDENPSELPDEEELREWLDEADEEELDDTERTESGEKIIGWRRVVRPELSMQGPCGLCVVAATNWYTRQNLKAIHNLCKCVTLPVTKTQDPGLRMNQEDLRANLDRIYGAAGGSTYGKDLKRLRVVVREHGELGPILTRQAKAGWTPIEGFEPYTPPSARVQRERLSKRQADLEGTKANLEARLAESPGAANLEAAIWEVEQQLRDLSSRLAA